MAWTGCGQLFCFSDLQRRNLTPEALADSDPQKTKIFFFYPLIHSELTPYVLVWSHKLIKLCDCHLATKSKTKIAPLRHRKHEQSLYCTAFSCIKEMGILFYQPLWSKESDVSFGCWISGQLFIFIFIFDQRAMIMWLSISSFSWNELAKRWIFDLVDYILKKAQTCWCL